MKNEKFQAVFAFKGRIKQNRVLFLFLFLILSVCAGCGSAGVGSATQSQQVSVTSGGVTLTVGTDKSKISFGNTEPFTLSAKISCPSVPCLSESNGVTFSYTSNGLISNATDTGEVTIDDGDADKTEVLTGSATFQWSGIIPTARGIAIITVTELSSLLSTSLTVTIE